MRRSGADSRQAIQRRQAREQGSAMLIVFLFAAIVAIMLYREMPVTLFEAQRQKEQLLVDRGHEYTRAVQLYYRRFRGQYPASIEQLENVNNMRFLRHRYKDPFTGKDDWRLLHAGFGGMLTDSKVNPLKQPNGGTGTNVAGQPDTSLQSTSGQPTPVNESSQDSEVVVQPIRSRPPAIAAGSEGAAGTPSSAELDQNPATPLLAPTPANVVGVGANGSQDLTAQAAPVSSPDGSAGNATANGGQQGGDTMNSVQSLLSSSANRTQPQQSAFGQGQQPTQFGGGAGGIAGIASKASGHSIKLVNDQSDYSLWEFYYDPRKDTSASMAGGGMGVPGMTGAPGTVNPTQNNSGFGSSNNSGFNNTAPINTDPNATVGPSTNGSNTGNPAPDRSF